MRLTIEDVLRELKTAVDVQKGMEKDYDCEMSNHVSNIVECILAKAEEDYDRCEQCGILFDSFGPCFVSINYRIRPFCSWKCLKKWVNKQKAEKE